MARPSLTLIERDEMRQRMTAAAFELYLADGLDAISFRALAEKLGISHTLAYRYFDSKDALLAAVRCAAVRRFEQFVRGRERADHAPLERVRAVFDGFIEYARHSPAEYQLIFASNQASPDHYPDLLAARRSLFEHVVDMTRACMPAGTSEAQARLFAHTVWVGLHGVMTLHIANQLVQGCTLEQIAPALFATLTAGLGGTDSARTATKKVSKLSAARRDTARGASR